MATVHQGDIGTIFRIQVVHKKKAVNIANGTALVRRIHFQKPNGHELIVAAELTTDGLDGKMEYAAVLGDLDQPGDWYMQGYVELVSEWKGRTTPIRFHVYPVVPFLG